MRLLDLDTWREVVQSLDRHRLRTMLTALGVMWGMFMLVVMLAFGRALHHGVMRNLGGYAAGTAVLWPSRTTLAHAGHAPGRTLTIRIDDLEALEGGIAGVAAIAPRNSLSGEQRSGNALVTRSTVQARLAVVGEDDALVHIRPMTFDAGRFINPLDVRDRRKVAFLGRDAHRRLFAGHDPHQTDAEAAIGTSIAIDGIEFTVAGVFAVDRTGDDAQEQQNSVVIPWTTLAHTFGPRDRVGAVAMLAAPGVDSVAMAEQARAVLRRRHEVHPEDDLAFGLWSLDREAARFRSLFAAIELLVWIVGGFTLLAGSLGVGNVTYVTVRERTREFGLRKALGATSGAIVGQVMLEAMTLTLTAGYLGLVAGTAVVNVAAWAFEQLPPEQRPEMLTTPVVEPASAMLGLGVLCVAGLIASYLPSQAAAAIEPARVLSAE